MWKKPYVQGDKPVEIDGTAHICPAKQSKKFVSTKFNLEQVPEIFEMACTLLDTLEEKQKLSISSADKAVFIESMFKTISGSYKN